MTTDQTTQTLPAEILLKRWVNQHPDHEIAPAIQATLTDLITARLECDRNLEYTKNELTEALAAATVEDMEKRLVDLLKWCNPVACPL